MKSEIEIRVNIEGHLNSKFQTKSNSEFQIRSPNRSLRSLLPGEFSTTLPMRKTDRFFFNPKRA
jgi:hypothetical protein